MSEEHNNQAQQRMVQVKEGALATVVIKPNEDAEVEKFECSRNVVRLQAEIGQRVDVNDGDAKIEVTVPAYDPDAEKDLMLCMYCGSPKEVMAQLQSKTITAQEAIVAVRRFLAEIGELSDIKASFITLFSEEAGLGGFTALTNHFTVQDEEIVQFVEGSAGQLAMFKQEMSKKGMKFPSDDDSGIIVPGQTPAGPPIVGG